MTNDTRSSGQKIALHQGIKLKVEVVSTLSSDEQGQPQIMVMVADDL